MKIGRRSCVCVCVLICRGAGRAMKGAPVRSSSACESQLSNTLALLLIALHFLNCLPANRRALRPAPRRTERHCEQQRRWEVAPPLPERK